MDIPEVPIREDERPSKAPAPKMQKLANEYLAQKGVVWQQLDARQRDCVIKYVKYKRGDKRMTLIYLAGTIIYACLFAVLYWVAMRMAADSAVGKQLVHLGVVTGCMACAFAGSLGHVLGRLLASIIRRLFGSKSVYEKIFDAFLPLVAGVP
jgi:hypothetical protein